jgi:type I restriction enzyme S subunit
LNAYFNSDETQRRLKSIASRAVSQSNISATRLSGFLVPCPKIDEQKIIVDQISAIDNKIVFHKEKKEKLEELFRTLLHQLMTAQIRVDNIDLNFLKDAA